jgi:peptide/nickel transport system permease protein
VTAPLDVPGAATMAQPESVLQGAGVPIAGRSLGQIAWMRLKRDKIAMGGGVLVILLVIMAVAAPLVVNFLGHPPQDLHTGLLDPDLGIPKGGWGGISPHYLLGIEPVYGRDVFSRIVYGARVSLLIAFLATLVSVVIGVVFGVVAGYYGGWVDTVISRLMDIFLAFPLLLFADAARSLGARTPYILVRELLPNLFAPILVYATLLIPTNILFEAALSYLGVGVQPPTPSWGQMLSDAVPLYQADPMYLIVPGMAIFITVMAFNLFGDGLRDALDPRAR